MNNLLINSARPNVSFGKDNNQKPKPKPTQSLNGTNLPFTKRLNMSPLTIGAINGACWFAAGVALDKLVAKVFKMAVNTKLSLALQGAFGLYMGYQGYKVAKREKLQA